MAKIALAASSAILALAVTSCATPGEKRATLALKRVLQAKRHLEAPLPDLPYDCASSGTHPEVHRSPPGAGVASITAERHTGNVPYMWAASNRGARAQDWLDDRLKPFEPGDGYGGPFPIANPYRFAAMPNNGTFLVRIYGLFSDDGKAREFSPIPKRCTPTQTQIDFYNGHDPEANFSVTITWTKPFP